MKVYFAPIPPDTISSLQQDLLVTARKYGLSDYITRCVAFCSVLDASLPNNEQSKKLIADMKKICEVCIYG